VFQDFGLVLAGTDDHGAPHSKPRDGEVPGHVEGPPEWNFDHPGIDPASGSLRGHTLSSGFRSTPGVQAALAGTEPRFRSDLRSDPDPAKCSASIADAIRSTK